MGREHEVIDMGGHRLRSIKGGRWIAPPLGVNFWAEQYALRTTPGRARQAWIPPADSWVLKLLWFWIGVVTAYGLATLLQG